MTARPAALIDAVECGTSTATPSLFLAAGPCRGVSWPVPRSSRSPSAAIQRSRPPSAIDALGALRHSNKWDAAETLAEFLEAVRNELDLAKIPLLLYQPPPLDILPRKVQAFVRAGARSMGCDPAYVLLSVLAALACAIGLSRRVRILRTWFESAILCCAPLPRRAQRRAHHSNSGPSSPEDRGRVAITLRSRACKIRERKNSNTRRSSLSGSANTDPESSPTNPRSRPEPRYVVSNTTVEALAPFSGPTLGAFSSSAMNLGDGFQALTLTAVVAGAMRLLGRAVTTADA